MMEFRVILCINAHKIENNQHHIILNFQFLNIRHQNFGIFPESNFIQACLKPEILCNKNFQNKI